LASIPVDFLVKSTGKGDLRSDLAIKLPLINAGYNTNSRISPSTASPPTTPPSGPKSSPPTSPSSAGANPTTPACRRTSSPASRPSGSATAPFAPTTPAAWPWWRSTCWWHRPWG
jgi:hypothetical protein